MKAFTRTNRKTGVGARANGSSTPMVSMRVMPDTDAPNGLTDILERVCANVERTVVMLESLVGDLRHVPRHAPVSAVSRGYAYGDWAKLMVEVLQTGEQPLRVLYVKAMAAGYPSHEEDWGRLVASTARAPQSKIRRVRRGVYGLRVVAQEAIEIEAFLCNHSPLPPGEGQA